MLNTGQTYAGRTSVCGVTLGIAGSFADSSGFTLLSFLLYSSRNPLAGISVERPPITMMLLFSRGRHSSTVLRSVPMYRLMWLWNVNVSSELVLSKNSALTLLTAHALTPIDASRRAYARTRVRSAATASFSKKIDAPA